MTNPNLTHIYFVLDRSGSMDSIKTDTEGGFNAFIEEQRKQDGECRVTLAQFDNEYEVVYRDEPVGTVPPLHLVPRGGTALLDAIGRLIHDAGARLSELPEDQRPGAVVFGIMTDGHENSSREFTHPAIKALIEQQSNAYGWQFLFMGADQDAIEVGTQLGVGADHSLTYSRGNVRAAMAATAGNVGAYRRARAAGMPADAARLSAIFTDEQREAAGE